MLDTVCFTYTPTADALKRLVQAGVQVVPAEEATKQHAEGRQVLVLGAGAAPSGALSWGDVAPQQARLAAGGCAPSTHQIMQAIAQYNRRQVMASSQGKPATDNPSSQPDQPLLVVGYVMKASREDALAASGLLHLLPQQGISFMPVDLDTLLDAQRLQQQQQEPPVHIDILLHKGSDELMPAAHSDSGAGDAAGAEPAAQAAAVPVGSCMSGPSAVGLSWSPRLRALQSWLTAHPQVCVVDPFEHTAKVLDRLLLAQLLQQLQGLQLPVHVKARGPAFLEVAGFAADLADAVAAAGLQPPWIVKPRVACGVSHSHSMALVLNARGLQELHGQLPVPALVQEFVNHGGLQYKAYVLGEQVFMTPRKSIPDIQGALSEQQQCLLFDSLASLPTQLPSQLTPQHQQQDSDVCAPTAQQQPPPAPDETAVRAIAAFLRQQLGLTLFGFDVVVASQQQQQQQQQQGEPAQELVVIDINYFPNYRGGTTEAPAMFRAALRQAWQQHQHQLNQ